MQLMHIHMYVCNPYFIHNTYNCNMYYYCWNDVIGPFLWPLYFCRSFRLLYHLSPTQIHACMPLQARKLVHIWHMCVCMCSMRVLLLNSLCSITWHTISLSRDWKFSYSFYYRSHSKSSSNNNNKCQNIILKFIRS